MSLSQQPATYPTPNKLLDGFRRALDVLIATAPGTSAEIQHELQDALRSFSQQGPIKAVNKQESRLAGHLMILGFSQLSKTPQAMKADYDSLGFDIRAKAIGIEATRSDGKSLITASKAEWLLRELDQLPPEQSLVGQPQAKRPASQKDGSSSSLAHTARASLRPQGQQSAAHIDHQSVEARHVPSQHLDALVAGAAVHPEEADVPRQPSRLPARS